MKWRFSGSVCTVVGNTIEAILPVSRLGMVASVEIPGADRVVQAEVVGFRNSKSVLLPFSDIDGIAPGSVVNCLEKQDRVPVGEFLLGKTIDPFLYEHWQSLGCPRADMVEIEGKSIDPLKRKLITDPMALGIKAIDGLLTFAEGQRIGIMAGSGVGKSVLLGMIARGSKADVNVIGLIGERGREVREFIEKDLGPEGIKRSVVVAVTSDQSPLLRLKGAKIATAIAEYFAATGRKVNLMLDSLTRVAQAQREIALAVGEIPATKGYPPSVFSTLSRLLERCGGRVNSNGSISGLYTVLVDGDDFNDPIPDAARAILDGHIILSRSLASKAHFPAIDISASVSRTMQSVVSDDHHQLAMWVKEMIAEYEENYDFLQMGTYHRGVNPQLDMAIELMPAVRKFLKQGIDEKSTFEESLGQLVSLSRSVQFDDQQTEAEN